MLYYTQEEKEKIIENLKTVETYIREKMIPRLREHELATVYVGKNMGLSISSDGNIRFTIGGLNLYFDSAAHRDGDIYENWSYGTKLLLGWYSFKTAMIDKLDGMEQDRKAIIDFHV